MHRWDALVGERPFEGIEILGVDDEGQYFAELFDDSGNRVEYAVTCDGDTWTFTAPTSRATATVEAPGQIAWNWEWRPSGDAGFLSASARRPSSRRASSRHRLRRRLTPARISAGGPFEQHLEWRRRSAPATLAVLTTMAPSVFPTFMTAPARHVWIALAVVYVVWGSTYFGIKVAVETDPAASRSRVALPGRSAPPRCDPRLARHVDADHACRARGQRDRPGLLLGLGVGLVHVAETRIDSSVAAIIAGTVPLQIIGLRLIAREARRVRPASARSPVWSDSCSSSLPASARDRPPSGSR